MFVQYTLHVTDMISTPARWFVRENTFNHIARTNNQTFKQISYYNYLKNVIDNKHPTIRV